jgi:hypothetical protein
MRLRRLAFACILVFIVSSVSWGGKAEAQIYYAQSVLHEIGDWSNISSIVGAPDGQFAYTDNQEIVPPGYTSTGAAVWLDFGKVIHSGTIVIYHDDPGGLRTNLAVGSWASPFGMPYPTPLATDGGSREANIQGTGVVTCYFVDRDFRYVRLDHFTTDTALQEGIDAVAVVEGNPPASGVLLDPPPVSIGPPLHGIAQSNNGYWSNPNAALGPPDGVYAWSANPSWVMPRMVIDLGRVVYSGKIVIHHAKPQQY